MKQAVQPIHNRFKSYLNLVAIRLLRMNIDFQVHHARNNTVLFYLAGLGSIACEPGPWFAFAEDDAVIAEHTDPAKLLDYLEGYLDARDAYVKDTVYVEK